MCSIADVFSHLPFPTPSHYSLDPSTSLSSFSSSTTSRMLLISFYQPCLLSKSLNHRGQRSTGSTLNSSLDAFSLQYLCCLNKIYCFLFVEGRFCLYYPLLYITRTFLDTCT
uniref:Uncharacterized protein n=1 Tax=Cacopsylla melanoneura TaxID=428564 RepID=A0A8D8TVW5_9HEMI